jgi:hypothetical protein
MYLPHVSLRWRPLEPIQPGKLEVTILYRFSPVSPRGTRESGAASLRLPEVDLPATNPVHHQVEDPIGA